MKFLIVEGDKEIIGHYPRGNDNYMEPLQGKHNPDLKIYVIVENQISYNYDYENLVKVQQLRKTTENYEGFEHLFIAYQDYEVTQKDETDLILQLDNELGGYIDSCYPVWQRDKHLREISLSKATGKRLQYLKDLDAWMDSCRALRDTKAQQIKQGQKPELRDWPQKPSENI